MATFPLQQMVLKYIYLHTHTHINIYTHTCTQTCHSFHSNPPQGIDKKEPQLPHPCGEF